MVDAVGTASTGPAATTPQAPPSDADFPLSANNRGTASATDETATIRADLEAVSRGDRGADVALLQNGLNALGFNSGRADGIFGAGTEQAVRDFQRSEGLSADGIVGRGESWPALHEGLLERRDNFLRDAGSIGADTPVGRALIADADMIGGLIDQLDGSAELAPVPGLTPAPGSTPASGLHPADPAGLLDDPGMNPTFVERVEATLDQLRAEGWDARIAPSGGFRSFAEQQRLYDQGRTTPGSIVTGAEPGESWHNYGLATDIVPSNANGQPTWPDQSPFWARLGEVAEENGLYWGGNFGDRPHVELHPGFTAGQAGRLIDEYNRGGLDEVWQALGLN